MLPYSDRRQGTIRKGGSPYSSASLHICEHNGQLIAIFKNINNMKYGKITEGTLQTLEVEKGVQVGGKLTEEEIIAQELTGNSILLLLYVLVHSKRMCKWYKLSIYSLLAIHVLNFAYHIKLIDVPVLLKLGICVNITSILFWLMFRITYKTAKVIHSACKHSEIE